MAHPRNRQDESDLGLLAHGIKPLHAFLVSANFEWRRALKAFPGLEVQGDHTKHKPMRSVAVSHPASTLQVKDNSNASISPCLKLHGMNELGVSVAPIRPSIAAFNTNPPSILIADRPSQITLEDDA